MTKKRRVLFLCTGNYYRSRFAETLFNHLASAEKIAWVADSCGLHVQADGVVNHGPLSAFAEAGLQMREIPLGETYRWPRQVCEADLAGSDRIIALKEAEHRAMLEKLHPEHVGRVEFWHIHDLDASGPLEALAALEARVRELVAELRAG